MNWFLKKILQFAFFIIVFYVALLIVFGIFIPRRFHGNLKVSDLKRNDFLFNRINEIKNYHHVDILFIGSSHVYRGYDPRILIAFGYKSFNLGSSSQTPVQSEILLNTYLYNLKPKLVVLDASPLMFQSDGVESEINFIMNLSAVNYHLISNVKNYTNVKMINTFLYQEITTMLNPSIKNASLNYTSNKYDNYISGGFVESHRMYSKEMTNLYFSNYWKPLDKQKKAMDDIITLLKNKHIKFIIVQTPVCKQFYSTLKNQYAIESYFQSKGKYYNFNNLIKLNDTTNFYDCQHLNQSGVEKFDRAFIKYCLINK